MEKNLPNRKLPRLQNFDYSSSAGYFITICTENRQKLLSTIYAPTEIDLSKMVGEGYGVPQTVLKPCGKIAEEQLLALEKRYNNVKLDKYVIMPNHIHCILFIRPNLQNEILPTISDVVCAFKSIVANKCGEEFGIYKIFQRSFYDHVIRNQQDYDAIAKYICDNPMSWHLDELYCD